MQKIVTFVNLGESSILDYQTKEIYFKKRNIPYFVYYSKDNTHFYQITPTHASHIVVEFVTAFDTCADYGPSFIADKDFRTFVDSNKINQHFLTLSRTDPVLLATLEERDDPNVRIVNIPDNIEWKIYPQVGACEVVSEVVATPHLEFDANGNGVDNGYK